MQLCGLITEAVPKSCAAEVAFGTTSVNDNRSSFGVTDLVDDLVETDSRIVPPLKAAACPRQRLVGRSLVPICRPTESLAESRSTK
jgi:hypothetical protein